VPFFFQELKESSDESWEINSAKRSISDDDDHSNVSQFKRSMISFQSSDTRDRNTPGLELSRLVDSRTVAIQLANCLVASAADTQLSHGKLSAASSDILVASDQTFNMDSIILSKISRPTLAPTMELGLPFCNQRVSASESALVEELRSQVLVTALQVAAAGAANQVAAILSSTLGADGRLQLPA